MLNSNFATMASVEMKLKLRYSKINFTTVIFNLRYVIIISYAPIFDDSAIYIFIHHSVFIVFYILLPLEYIFYNNGHCYNTKYCIGIHLHLVFKLNFFNISPLQKNSKLQHIMYIQYYIIQGKTLKLRVLKFNFIK